MTLEIWKALALGSIGLWFVTLLYLYRPDLKETKKPKFTGNPGDVLGADED